MNPQVWGRGSARILMTALETEFKAFLEDTLTNPVNSVCAVNSQVSPPPADNL
jgi:hypothetical protein